MSFESLSNDEIADRLKQLGLPGAAVTKNTRLVYIRKLQKLTGSELSSSTSANQSAPSSSRDAKPPADTPKKVESTPDGYYGICGLSRDIPGTTQSPVYQSKEDVDRVLKSNPGARFKWFKDQEGAETFSKTVLPTTPSTMTASQRAESTANPEPSFKNKTVEKNKLKCAIEKGDVDTFRAMADENPTILVDTTSEVPEICHPGSRRNALHVAANAGRVDICRMLFKILGDDQFWERIFPKDDAEMREEKKSRLIDLYLNNQEGENHSKSFNTPLHLACKRGHAEVVEYLMSFTEIDTSVRNYYGETCVDVIESAGVSSEAKERIKELISTPPIYYVSVLRSMDIPSPASLSTPLTLQDLSGSLTGSPTVGHALAGPMSLPKAQVVHKEWKKDREWKSPVCDSVEKASSIKRSDADRGLERVGRQLAHSMNIKWAEYWDFLECYADLSTEEGLQKLDNYLANMAETAIPMATPISPAEASPKLRVGNRAIARSLNVSKDPSLTRALFSDGYKDTDDVREMAAEFESLSLNTKDEKPVPGELVVESDRGRASPNDDDGDKSCDTLARQLGELELPKSQYRTPPRDSAKKTDRFITGQRPTKLDRDVYLALGDTAIDRHKYPHIHRWKSLVTSYSAQDQKRWRTPAKKPSYCRLDSNVCSSPLICSSPLLLSPSSRHTPLRHKAHQTTPTRLLDDLK